MTPTHNVVPTSASAALPYHRSALLLSAFLQPLREYNILHTGYGARDWLNIGKLRPTPLSRSSMPIWLQTLLSQATAPLLSVEEAITTGDALQAFRRKVTSAKQCAAVSLFQRNPVSRYSKDSHKTTAVQNPKVGQEHRVGL